MRHGIGMARLGTAWTGAGVVLLLSVSTAAGQAGTAGAAAPTGGCIDAIDGWSDTYGDSCAGYSSWGYCTAAGGYGTNWDLTWGVRPTNASVPLKPAPLLPRVRARTSRSLPLKATSEPHNVYTPSTKPPYRVRHAHLDARYESRRSSLLLSGTVQLCIICIIEMVDCVPVTKYNTA